MTVRQLIPADLGQMAPGPELGVLLAGIDIHALTGSDAVEVLQARVRQLSYEQARVLATLVEVGLCDPEAANGAVARLAESPVGAVDEIRAALSWTRLAADRELRFAEKLVLEMPAVFTALETGVICRSKAWLFADMCAELTPEQTAVVCTRLLPRAGRLTTGELAARIKKLAIALDPDWAARRYASAVRERNVIGYLDPDGTATVTVTGLPVDQAAAACARVEELALAAKHAGHPGRIGPLRTPAPEVHIPPNDVAVACDAGDGAPTDTAAEPAPAPGPDTSGSDTSGGDAEDRAAPRGAEQGLGTGEPVIQNPAGTAPLVRRVGVEIRVGLSTLLGRDEHPGEVPAGARPRRGRPHPGGRPARRLLALCDHRCQRAARARRDHSPPTPPRPGTHRGSVTAVPGRDRRTPAPREPAHRTRCRP